MEHSAKIAYHAMNAYIHLQALIDMKVPELSSTSEALLKDAAHLADSLSEIHSKIARGG